MSSKSLGYNNIKVVTMSGCQGKIIKPETETWPCRSWAHWGAMGWLGRKLLVGQTIHRLKLETGRWQQEKLFQTK